MNWPHMQVGTTGVIPILALGGPWPAVPGAGQNNLLASTSEQGGVEDTKSFGSILFTAWTSQAHEG